MKIFPILRVATAALLRNRSRSLLTMLGVVIGVAAVIVTVAIGTAGAPTTVVLGTPTGIVPLREAPTDLA